MNEPFHFTHGDKVRVKGRTQIMTVEAAPDHMAYCVWFEDTKPHQGTFHFDSLELVRHAGDVPDSRFAPLK